jgi:hypothetical protein
MQTAADKTAKRVSAAEWFARYDAKVLARARTLPPQRPAADRVAVRT